MFSLQTPPFNAAFSQSITGAVAGRRYASLEVITQNAALSALEKVEHWPRAIQLLHSKAVVRQTKLDEWSEGPCRGGAYMDMLPGEASAKCVPFHL